MTQTTLFDDAGERDRVREKIAPAIKEYGRTMRGQEFHMDDLRRYVARFVGPVAPASSDRILRDLRQRKQIDYVVVSRRKSTYIIKEVA